MFADTESSELRVYMRALIRVLDLKGDITEDIISETVGEAALHFLEANRSLKSFENVSSSQSAEKAAREESIRARLRESEEIDTIAEAITEAESIGMSFEANLGRRKLSKLFPS